ncbi:MAG: hypothetical protein GF418_17215 [Chitinivibrionales bacterium]|nr:hypothetical protein [Chitinivibrionales bacterium]MBD3397360.1 hypothetical protein [Chitinivibrionales bacterium]
MTPRTASKAMLMLAWCTVSTAWAQWGELVTRLELEAGTAYAKGETRSARRFQYGPHARAAYRFRAGHYLEAAFVHEYERWEESYYHTGHDAWKRWVASMRWKTSDKGNMVGIGYCFTVGSLSDQEYGYQSSIRSYGWSDMEISEHVGLLGVEVFFRRKIGMLRLGYFGRAVNSDGVNLYSMGSIHNRFRIDYRLAHALAAALELCHWYGGESHWCINPRLLIGCKAFTVEVGPAINPAAWLHNEDALMFWGSARMGLPWEPHDRPK